MKSSYRGTYKICAHCTPQVASSPCQPTIHWAVRNSCALWQVVMYALRWYQTFGFESKRRSLSWKWSTALIQSLNSQLWAYKKAGWWQLPFIFYGDPQTVKAFQVLHRTLLYTQTCENFTFWISKWRGWNISRISLAPGAKRSVEHSMHIGGHDWCQHWQLWWCCPYFPCCQLATSFWSNWKTMAYLQHLWSFAIFRKADSSNLEFIYL